MRRPSRTGAPAAPPPGPAALPRGARPYGTAPRYGFRGTAPRYGTPGRRHGSARCGPGASRHESRPQEFRMLIPRAAWRDGTARTAPPTDRTARPGTDSRSAGRAVASPGRRP
ncbi:hypothetical protein DEH18_24900 [Streptomyces sp. NHF165]|uniref:Uncharacterized protein n=1 Tax=Streptomyces cacaoi TaxID=1898 RepID=A0A4Y3QXB5_STRCI|nr:hypothetical protein DEH18_24900 [Streptomyces sp. NHF165]GEB50066.1 hypothetical protein SCA03_26170 [Streptomyces cacaoi]